MKKSALYIIVLIFILVAAGDLSAQNKKSKKKKQTTESSCPLIDSIIDFSMTKLGCAYKSAGTGPRGFDCSGLMYYTFGQFNIKLGRSSRDQFLMGEKVERNDIQRGDLVFWYRGKGYIGHVGLVVAVDSAHNFQFIHASTYGKGVRLDYSTSNWYTSTYAGARRIIRCDSTGRAFFIERDKVTELDSITMPVIAQKDTLTSVQDSAAVQNPPQKVIYHKIKSGETLSSIARKYHVTVNQIKKWNRLKSDLIRAGDKLKIHRKQ